MGKLRRLVRRLASAQRDELLDRGRQEFAKRSDGLFAAIGYDFARSQLSAAGQPAGTFFFSPGAVPSLVEIVRERLPQDFDRTLAQAEKICQHRFDLLGYENLEYETSIDWHLDRVHGRRAPRQLFYKIPYLDFEKVGDSKVTWELNRHQHLATLAKAYRFTGDARFVTELMAQWKDWHRNNPYPIGINWASSLEVAFRSLSWFWVYYLLAGTPVFNSDFRQEWLRAQALNGRHIERYLSTYFSPNTHLLGEAVALFFLGTLCPELKSASRWKSLGWQIVLREARRQVQADGLHFEQSVYYHVYALDFFLHAAILANANGITAPKHLEETLLRMLEALALLSRFGPPPRIGDDDGGRLSDPRRNKEEHLTDPLATGAILFGRGDFKQLAGSLREETIWLLGAAAAAEWDRIVPQAVNKDSQALQSAGLYCMVVDHPGGQLIIDAGPQGTQTAGHGHADALAIWLQSQGRNLLIDAGTGSYVGADRARFRTTLHHNALVVDDCSQSEPRGPFSWSQLTDSRADKWIKGKSFDYFAGVHDGYARLNPEVLHRRTVFSLHNGLFLVRDVVLGRGSRQLSIRWNLHPELTVEKGNTFVAPGQSGGIAILSVEDDRWQRSVTTVEFSPAYGLKQDHYMLAYEAQTDLPAEFVTLLITLGGTNESGEGTLSRISAKPNVDVRGYRYVSETAEYSFFFNEGSQPWECNGLSSDSEVVCRRRCPGSEQLILCQGSFARVKGGLNLQCKSRVQWCELLVSEGVREVACADPAAVERENSDHLAALVEQGTESAN